MSNVYETWFIVPLSSLPSSYQDEYSCGFPSCSGHGECMLIIDQSIINQSSFNQSIINQTFPIIQSNVDMEDLSNSLTSLPYSICLCDNDYITHSDLIQYPLEKHLNCDISQSANIITLSLSLALYALLALIASYKLILWFQWHIAQLRLLYENNQPINAVTACEPVSDDLQHLSMLNVSWNLNNPSIYLSNLSNPRSLFATPQQHHLTQPTNNDPNDLNRTSSDLIRTSSDFNRFTIEEPSPIPINGKPDLDRNPSTTQIQSHTLSLEQSDNPSRNDLHMSPQSQPLHRVEPIKPINACPINSRRFSRLSRLKSHCWRIQFLHPLCALFTGIFGVIYFTIRLSTTMLLGREAVMSVIYYIVCQASFLTMVVAQYYSTKLTLSMVRSQVKGSGNVILLRDTARYATMFFRLMIVVNASVCVVYFIIMDKSLDQSKLFPLVLILAFLPVWMICALAFYNSFRASMVISGDVDTLNNQQQGLRAGIAKTMRRQVVQAVLLFALTVALNVSLVAVPDLRTWRQTVLLMQAIANCTSAITRLFVTKLPAPTSNINVPSTPLKQPIKPTFRRANNRIAPAFVPAGHRRHSSMGHLSIIHGNLVPPNPPASAEPAVGLSLDTPSDPLNGRSLTIPVIASPSYTKSMRATITRSIYQQNAIPSPSENPPILGAMSQHKTVLPPIVLHKKPSIAPDEKQAPRPGVSRTLSHPISPRSQLMLTVLSAQSNSVDIES